MQKIDKCPVCEGHQFHKVMEVKDHFLSEQLFFIDECNQCGHRFTNPFPDPDELNQYYESEDYISHSSTSKGIVNRLYKFLRNYTIRQKYNLIYDRKRGHKILDIGSGTGELLNEFVKHNWETAGVEPNKTARDKAINGYGLEIYDEYELQNFPSGYYDVISMWHVLEHVSDIKSRSRELSRLIKDDGIFVIALPNFKAFDALNYESYWAAWDVPRHLHHFTESSLQTLFQSYGFRIDEKLPMKFDSYYVSMLSEKYKNGKLNYIKAFKRGWRSNNKAIVNMNYSSLIYVLRKS